MPRLNPLLAALTLLTTGLGLGLGAARPADAATRRGLARSVEVAARGEHASSDRAGYASPPAGSARFIAGKLAEIRQRAREQPLLPPGSDPVAAGLDQGTRIAIAAMAAVFGQTATDARATTRVHDRRMKKAHRRAIHALETARDAGLTVKDLFPRTRDFTFEGLIAAEHAAIAAIDSGERHITPPARPAAKRAEKSNRTPLPVGIRRRDRTATN